MRSSQSFCHPFTLLWCHSRGRRDSDTRIYQEKRNNLAMSRFRRVHQMEVGDFVLIHISFIMRTCVNKCVVLRREHCSRKQMTRPSRVSIEFLSCSKLSSLFKSQLPCHVGLKFTLYVPVNPIYSGHASRIILSMIHRF